MKTQVAIVTGGVSSEREISIKSAKAIQDHLSEDRYAVEVFCLPADAILFSKAIGNFDIVIPVIHGKGGEDGEVTALCESHGVPCFFTGVDSHRLCIDKFICTEFVKQCGFRVPQTYLCQKHEDIYGLGEGTFFIKPVNGGSSLDAGKFTCKEQMRALAEKIWEYDSAIVQEYLTGREFTVSLAGEKDTVRVLAISEIITTQEFFDFQAKYELKNTQEHTPANIKPALKKKIEEAAIQIYKACDISCLGRIDFIYNEESDLLYFLEINTIPGFTENSFFPQAILHSGNTINGFLHQKIQKYLVPEITKPKGRIKSMIWLKKKK